MGSSQSLPDKPAQSDPDLMAHPNDPFPKQVAAHDMDDDGLPRSPAAQPAKPPSASFPYSPPPPYEATQPAMAAPPDMQSSSDSRRLSKKERRRLKRLSGADGQDVGNISIYSTRPVEDPSSQPPEVNLEGSLPSSRKKKSKRRSGGKHSTSDEHLPTPHTDIVSHDEAVAAAIALSGMHAEPVKAEPAEPGDQASLKTNKRKAEDGHGNGSGSGNGNGSNSKKRKKRKLQDTAGQSQRGDTVTEDTSMATDVIPDTQGGHSPAGPNVDQPARLGANGQNIDTDLMERQGIRAHVTEETRDAHSAAAAARLGRMQIRSSRSVSRDASTATPASQSTSRQAANDTIRVNEHTSQESGGPEVDSAEQKGKQDDVDAADSQPDQDRMDVDEASSAHSEKGEHSPSRDGNDEEHLEIDGEEPQLPMFEATWDDEEARHPQFDAESSGSEAPNNEDDGGSEHEESNKDGNSASDDEEPEKDGNGASKGGKQNKDDDGISAAEQPADEIAVDQENPAADSESNADVRTPSSQSHVTPRSTVTKTYGRRSARNKQRAKPSFFDQTNEDVVDGFAELPRNEVVSSAKKPPKTAPRSSKATPAKKPKLSQQMQGSASSQASKIPKTPASSRPEPVGGWRQGPFAYEELEAIKHAVELFRDRHQLTQTEVNALIWEPMTPRTEFKDEFWNYIMDACAGRAPRQRQKIINFCRKQFHNFVARGKWTKEQDEELGAMIEMHGPKWSKIGGIINRHPDDIRDRYRNYLKWGASRRQYTWNEEEEAELISAVADAMEKIQKMKWRTGELRRKAHENPEEMIHWMSISERVGTRSYLQCRNKWKDLKSRVDSKAEVAEQSTGSGRSSRQDVAHKQWREMTAEDKHKLIRAIGDTGVGKDSKIPWKKLANSEYRRTWTQPTLKLAWSRLQQAVDGYEHRTTRDNAQALLDQWEQDMPFKQLDHDVFDDDDKAEDSLPGTSGQTPSKTLGKTPSKTPIRRRGGGRRGSKSQMKIISEEFVENSEDSDEEQEDPARPPETSDEEMGDADAQSRGDEEQEEEEEDSPSAQLTSQRLPSTDLGTDAHPDRPMQSVEPGTHHTPGSSKRKRSPFPSVSSGPDGEDEDEIESGSEAEEHDEEGSRRGQRQQPSSESHSGGVEAAPKKKGGRRAKKQAEEVEDMEDEDEQNKSRSASVRSKGQSEISSDMDDMESIPARTSGRRKSLEDIEDDD